MKNSILLALIGLLFLQCSSTKPTFEALNKGTWQEIKSLDGSKPVARHEAAFVSVGDRFFLVGGRRMNPVSIYDTKTQKWTQGAIPPIELHHFQPFVYKNEIYIAGAMTGQYPGETPLPNMYIYNPDKDQWRLGPALPPDRLRGGAGVALVGDQLYLSCGIKDGHRGDHKKWLDRYDFKTDSWTILADAPRARDHFQIQIVDGKLYNLGGRTTISADNPFKHTIYEVDVYDIESQTWSTLAEDLPTARAGNFTLLLNDEILVLGGESFRQTPGHAEVEALNIKTLKWRSLPPIPQGRHGTGVVLYKGKLYTSSGSGNRGGGPELTDLWSFSF